MKKLIFGFLTGMTAFLLLTTGCDTGYKADLEKILNPGALPYLKPSKFIQVSSTDTSDGNNDRFSIPAGKTATILDVPGPGVITRIWFTVDSRDPYFLRRILIRMYWDDEEDPSVEVPFGDFFGNGFCYRHYSTPYLSMSSGGYSCYFPMPFEDRARIEIVNETGQEIPAFYFQVDYQKLEGYLSRDIGYFHAFWKRDIRTDYDSNYTLLRIKGKGHIVGVNLNMQSYNGNLGFLEGDEKVFVDNEKNPSIHGTGTEDYFSSGWYFSSGEYAGPYNGLILKDDTLGRIAAYRFHVPDPIPFKKSVKFTIEHGHGNQEIADYASTVYWYQLEPHQKFPPILKAGMRIPLRGTPPAKLLEAENLKIDAGKIRTETQDMSDYGPEWSGSRQLVLATGHGDSFRLTLDKLNEPQYNVNIYFTRGPDYGNVEIFHNDLPTGKIEGFSPTLIPGGKITLQGLQNPGSKLDLRFVVTRRDSLSSGYKTGLDGIEIVPKRIYIPEWYIIGPFPNPRISEGLRLGLDSIYPPEISVDLAARYPGIGGKPVSWKYVKTPENGYLDLTELMTPYEMAVCYAVTYLFSPAEQSIPLLVGSDDGMKVFYNNRLLYRFTGVRIAEPDQQELTLKLKPGWNKLLLKIENNFGGYAFYARIIDRNKTIAISADQKQPEKGK
jgi:hypothetical protein